GIGNGNGDDVDITAPITGVLNISGNSFTLIGNSSSSSVNTAPTTTSNTVNDNDTIDNGNSGGTGSGSGNGSGDGLLNGAASG
ncbi:hypothetical protein ACUTDA_18665, partial [Acinetobacter baumannii]